MTNALVSGDHPSGPVLPALIAGAGEHAAWRFIEFFTVNIRNANAQAAFRDGYFRTGDLATLSPDGYYTLSDRKSDLIISGGFNIYPREIEEFLQEQRGVKEAAVVGVPDRLRGEVPVAYIVADGAFDAAVLEAECRQKLASFKVPRGFLPVEQLPPQRNGQTPKTSAAKFGDAAVVMGDN